MKILIVEDDTKLLYNLKQALEIEGYDTICCASGDEGLYYIKENSCDLVILDWMLPEISGIEILQEIRGLQIMTPVILLTALTSVGNKVTALDCGADDYLSKPFDMRELLARVRANIRRPSVIENNAILFFGDLKYDTLSLKLTCNETTIDISKTLGALLELFIKSGTTPVTRHTIFARVWGVDSDVDYSIIDNYIGFLRRRLKHLKSSVKISTIRGVGYSFEYNGRV